MIGENLAGRPKPTNAASHSRLRNLPARLAPSSSMVLSRCGDPPMYCQHDFVEQLNSSKGDLIDGALPAFTFATSLAHGALHLHVAGTAQPEKRSVFRHAR